jgi:hypothetical protein
MSETKSRPTYVVLQQVADDSWRLVGEAERRPGLTAKRARVQAVADALGREPAAGETYAAILRSEWRISFDL